MKKAIPYGKQYIDRKDIKYVLSSLQNDLITTGPYVLKFENEVKKYFKSKFSYVCSSGTAAIHLALMSLNLKKNDVILMPAINFIASYNLAKMMNLKVYLLDVDKHTGQSTPEKVLECIKQNNLKKIKALIIMHHGGYPQFIKKFYDLKKKYNFFIIEDACHALGSEYKYKNKFYKIGSCKHSDICTFSLHPVKTITTGEGGIITVNDQKLAKRIELLRSHGISRDKVNYWKYDVLENGLNYRLSDLNCALGVSQMNKLKFFLLKRKKIYNKYVKELKNFNSHLHIPEYFKNIKFSYHLFLIHIEFDKLKKNKDNFLRYLNKNDIIAQYHYIPIYKFKVFGKKRAEFKEAEIYYKNTISLPIFVNLKNKDQNKIITAVKNYFK